MNLFSSRSPAVLCSVLLLAGTAKADSITRPPRRDRQIWTELDLRMPVQGHMELAVDAAVRIGRDASRPVYERIGASLIFGLGKHLTLAPAYHYVAAQPYAPVTSREHRLHIEGSVHMFFGRWTLSDRSRFEYRIINGDRSVRYRNRLQLERPLGFARLDMFISDEIQYDSRYDAWGRNRFVVGVRKDLNPRSSLDMFYLRQNDGYSHPGDIHAIGLTLRARLKR